MTEEKNVFWIASYPKSGNTWVRFIVCNILKGGPVENSGEIQSLTPDVHRWSLTNLPQDRDMLYLKTHWACTPDIPLYDRTAGAIYVVRHPGDVMVSNLAYLGVSKKKWAPLVDQFIQVGGLAHWTRFGMGTWLSNVQSWAGGQHPFPVHTIGYESLLRAPVEGIRNIAEHIRHPISEADAERIAQETSFSKMRAMELRERNSATANNSFFVGQASADPHGKRVFMRSGKSRQFSSLLTAQQTFRFAERFGRTLEQLNLQA